MNYNSCLLNYSYLEELCFLYYNSNAKNILGIDGGILVVPDRCFFFLSESVGNPFTPGVITLEERKDKPWTPILK